MCRTVTAIYRYRGKVGTGFSVLCTLKPIPPPIIMSAYNCIYSILYLSHRYCYLPLSWKSWNWFECGVHTQTNSCAHYQERIQLYLQHLVFVAPLLLSAAVVEELELV
jgi:hypothetical protein